MRVGTMVSLAIVLPPEHPTYSITNSVAVSRNANLNYFHGHHKGPLREGLSEIPSRVPYGGKEDWFPGTLLSVTSVNQNNGTWRFPMFPAPARQMWRWGGCLDSSRELATGGQGTTIVDSPPLVYNSHIHDRNKGQRVSQPCAANLFNDHPV